jgi:NTP pyrophosphatase (non-canonical NTP hydrolase)
MIDRDLFKTMLDVERDRQDEKWGAQDHSDEKWLVILMEEVGEIAKAMLEKDEDEMIFEMIHSAAVISAWFECVGRRRES